MADYIYCLTSKTTHKRYIGRSTTPLNRICAHLSGYGSKKVAQAVAREGVENFTWQIVEEVNDAIEGGRREVALIAANNTTVTGFNDHPGGSGCVKRCLGAVAAHNKRYSAAMLCEAVALTRRIPGWGALMIGNVNYQYCQ